MPTSGLWLIALRRAQGGDLALQRLDPRACELHVCGVRLVVVNLWAAAGAGPVTTAMHPAHHKDHHQRTRQKQ